MINNQFALLSTDESLKKTVKALKKNNMNVLTVENGKKAEKQVLELIPNGSQVFTMSSVTLDKTEISRKINDSGDYDSVRNKLYKMDRETQGREMARLGAAPDWVVASVQAVTEEGQILIASNTGSQLSAEAYAGGKIVFVVGTQKIVKDIKEGMKRIYEYILPMEDNRAQEVYGMHSNVSKILIINKEIMPDRITVILVKEVLGF